jgi:excisionase family DNA binding protein
MKNDLPGYATIREAATRLGVTKQRVSQLFRQGRIPFKVTGSRCLIRLSELENFASINRPTGRRRPSPFDD